jgi:phage tail sheath protein FI
MATYRAPDVYVEEIPSFPPSVAEVGTAIPAFIGYTEKALRSVAGDLVLKPFKIYSLKEFESYFGSPRAEEIAVEVTTDVDARVPSAAIVQAPALDFLLYYCVKLYFDNGGAQCYIASVGDYSGDIDKAELLAGLAAVGLEDEPTLLVIPEATRLTYAEYKDVSGATLRQCQVLGDRFAILDVWRGDLPDDAEVDTAPATKQKLIQANREAWAGELKYGAAYYPFLRTVLNHRVLESESNVKVTIRPAGSTAELTPEDLGSLRATKTAIYNFVKLKLKDEFITLPPSSAVAGVYAATDAGRGVWKAPANAALLGVLEPVVKLSRAKQEELNVDDSAGKSINAIRAFAGKGTLIWGARTLAGNDNEWRYVSVRRFFSMVEESIKKSTY